MSSNLAYRQYLTNNANIIIKNNLNVALGNCSNVEPVLPNLSIASTPILYNSIVSNPSPYDNQSDLKDYFLKEYIKISGMSTPGIRFYN